MNTTSEIRVLHVDDDKLFLNVSKKILACEGPFFVETAFSVDEALEKLDLGTFDVIVSDYEMSFKNGLDFLKTVREKGLKIPFILFAGKEREEIIVQALNLGADRYVNKLGDPEIVYTELTVNIFQLYEKSRAQRMLWESEERFKKMVTNIKDCIMLTQSDGIILYLSPSCKTVLGYEPSDLVGKVPWIIHPEDLERVQKIFQIALTNEISGTTEYRILTKKGETRWVSHSYSQIVEKGEIKQIVSTLQDITEEKKAEDKLEESEKKFSAAFNSSGAALAITRLVDGLFVEANDCFLKTFQYTREEVIGKTVTMLRLYADRNDRKEIVNLIQNNQAVINREVKVTRKDGIELTVLFSTNPFNVKGEMHLLTTLIDISNLKQTEKSLFLRKKELEHFLAISPDAVTIANNAGRIVDCNAAALKTFGYDQKHEIWGLPLSYFIVEQDHQKLLNNVETVLGGKQVKNIILTGKKKNGEKLILECSANAIFDEAGKPTAFVAITRDVTDRHRIEEKLRESEERYRFVAENAQDLITVTDATGTFLYVSPSVKNILGLNPEDLTYKKSVLQYITPEDRAKYEPQMKLLIETGKLPPLEFRFLNSNGVYVFLESKISKVYDASGQIRFITISRDMTERKKAHEERDKALAQAELLLEKSRVVGGFVRHDIRNKLSIITGSMFLSKKYANNNLQMLREIERIGYTIENIVHILEFAQTYQAVGDQGLSWINVYNSIKEAQSLFLHLKGVQIDVSNVGFEVQADVALTEIFHNLLDNSLKYGKNLTQIKIYAEKEADYIKLIYEDNGGGIDSKIKPRLFQKGAGNGTGLGLYLIQRICDIYCWRIQESGKLGVGVRFIIEIPQKLTRPLENQTVSVGVDSGLHQELLSR